MAEQRCMYPDRESVLVAYLYDEVDAMDRVTFEAHVAVCEPCRTALADFRSVRTTLGEWAAPESTTRRLHSPLAARPSHWWHAIPAWAQVAAALLALGVSASIANLDVRYDRANGLSVRTGWSAPAAPRAATLPAPTDDAPWRADLAALKTQLLDEMHTQSATVTAAAAPAPASGISDAELRTRVRALLDESEQQQRNDVALKLVQLQKDVYAQQQADLSRVYRAIGLVQNTTRGELANQRQVLSLAVSQRQ